MAFLRSTALGVFMLLPVFTAACRTDTKNTGTLLSSDTVAAAASGAETFFRYGLTHIATNRDDLKENYGKADSVVARAVQNRHDAAQTDSIVTLYYPGLAVELYRVSANGREFPASVRVTDNTYIKPDAPIRIGMPESDLTGVMGSSESSAGGINTYACDTCTALGNEKVDVQIASGAVVAVTIRYSYD